MLGGIVLPWLFSCAGAFSLGLIFQPPKFNRWMDQFLGRSESNSGSNGNHRHTLEVTVKQAELHDFDAGWGLEGDADAYAYLQFGDSNGRTKTKDNTARPVWNEIASFPVHLNSRADLTVTLYDDDTIGSDKIGETSRSFADIKQILDSRNVAEFSEWRQLMRPGEEPVVVSKLENANVNKVELKYSIKEKSR